MTACHHERCQGRGDCYHAHFKCSTFSLSNRSKQQRLCTLPLHSIPTLRLCKANYTSCTCIAWHDATMLGCQLPLPCQNHVPLLQHAFTSAQSTISFAHCPFNQGTTDWSVLSINTCWCLVTPYKHSCCPPQWQCHFLSCIPKCNKRPCNMPSRTSDNSQ